jgi:hypothetical protein
VHAAVAEALKRHPDLTIEGFVLKAQATAMPSGSDW